MSRDLNLKRFNGDKAMKEDLKSYLISYYEHAIIDAALNGKDVKPIAESINQLKKALDQLDIDYAIPEDTTPTENQAR